MSRNRKILVRLLALLTFIVLVLIVWATLSSYLYYRRDLRSGQMHVMPPPLAGETILIFAPHEDDEMLGAGGYIQQAVAAGAHVHLVFMTNGEYPEIDVILFERSLSSNPQRFIRLGLMRQQESLNALQFLGVPRANVAFLGYPNGYLYRMWEPAHWLPGDPVTSARTRSTHAPYANAFTPHAGYCGQSVLQDVETVLHAVQPDIVITLHPEDIHVDHWPTYTFVQYALLELAARGEGFAAKARLYTYLIHRPPWPEPRGYWPELPLLPPAPLVSLQQTDWLSLPLKRAETDNKHRALACYHTQGGAFDPLLQAFPRANELFGAVPIQRWTSSPGPPRTIVRDPAADNYLSAGNPSGDILAVTLGVDAHNAMTAGLQVRGPAGPGMVYHFALHGGGVTAADRVFVEYDWTTTSSYGLKLRNGKLQTLDAKTLRVAYAGNITKLTAPWPLQGTPTAFFMARAWTTAAHRETIIDQTATATFTIPPPASPETWQPFDRFAYPAKIAMMGSVFRWGSDQ